MAWNGYDGNIYITSAYTLPNFQPPRILIAKTSKEQKNWYPNLIDRNTGDRIGGQHLHLYFRDHPNGPGKGSVFRKTSFKLMGSNSAFSTTLTSTGSAETTYTFSEAPTTTTTVDPGKIRPI